MDRYEDEVNEIMAEKYSDFKKYYQDLIKECASMVDDTIEEVKNN